MSINEVRVRRDKELLQKGKYYNPVKLQNEIEINIQKKNEASKEDKLLREHFLNSIKNDINQSVRKKEDQKQNDLKHGEMMIQLDKSFVEERKKKEKDKYDRYQIESFKDYQEYIKKKDSFKFNQKRNQTEDRENLSLKLKPDERFFKYQENYLKKIISPSLKSFNIQSNIQIDSNNRINYDKTPKKDNLNEIYNKPLLSSNDNNKFYVLKNNNYYDKQEDQNKKICIETVSNNNKLYHSLDENSINKYKGIFNPVKHDRKVINYNHQIKTLDQTNIMTNPYNLKNINFWASSIKDNPLVFNESPIHHNQFNNSSDLHSSLKIAGSQVLQKS